MKKTVPLLLAAAAAALCLGCSALPRATETSAWYRTRLKEAAAYNEARGNRIIGSKELWTGTVCGIDAHRLILKDRECLYSPPSDTRSGGYCNAPEDDSFFGACIEGCDWGGYCNAPKDDSFLLETQHLSPPLKPGDRIVFVATHTLSFSLLDGTGHPHPVDGARIAKIDPGTGEPFPHGFVEGAGIAGKRDRFAGSGVDFRDPGTLNEAMRERLAFGTLVSAFFKGLPALEQALRDGSDPNTVSPVFGGKTFFTWMLAHRNAGPDHVILLLKYGADPSKISPDGQTPLMAAARNETYPVTFCRLLLNAGADPNQDTGFKEEKRRMRQDDLPPLFTAVRRNHLALAELLLEHGADPLLALPSVSPAPSGVPDPALRRTPQIRRPADEVRDHRMAALLRKYLKDPAQVPSLTKAIREKTAAPVPVTE